MSRDIFIQNDMCRNSTIILLEYQFLQKGLPYEMIYKILDYIPNQDVENCLVKYCNRKALLGCKWCNMHICGDIKCYKISTIGPYCEDHKCIVDFCKNRALNSYQLCINHKCVYAGCSNRTYGNSKCNTHLLKSLRCKVRGCDNHPINLDYDYCFDHKCLGRGCQMRRTFDLDFCAACICAVKGCNYERYTTHLGDISEYCPLHKCGIDRCVRRAIIGKRYCRLCI